MWCVIEVADSSLSLDLGPKLRMYATAGIAQYVVVDLVNHRVLVHETPSADAYARVTTLAHDLTANIRAGSGFVAMDVQRLLP